MAVMLVTFEQVNSLLNNSRTLSFFSSGTEMKAETIEKEILMGCI